MSYTDYLSRRCVARRTNAAIESKGAQIFIKDVRVAQPKKF